MGTLGSTWQIVKASGVVIRENKRLLILPILSTISLALVLASFIAPVVASNWSVIAGEEKFAAHGGSSAGTSAGEAEEVELNLGAWEPPGENAPAGDYVRFYGLLLGFYFANYFVIVFFNSAIVAASLFWMRDGRSSLAQGLGAAVKRLPQVIGWAALSATVGLVLRIIESHRRGAQIVAAILGTAWTVMTYLAVPVLVVEGKGPLGALKGSAALLRKSWGQQIVGGFGFGIIYFLLSLLGVAIIGVGVYLAGALGNPAVALIFVAAAVVYFVVLFLVSAVQGPVFQAALYVYAKEGHASGSFGEEMLRNAFRPK